MSDITFDPDVGQTAINELAYIFRVGTNIHNFVESLFVPMQQFEDSLEQLYLDLWVFQATGVQLDGFGDLVGQPRNGEDDIHYLISILAKIGENNSQSRLADVISVFNILSGSTSTHVVEAFPASLSIVGNQNIRGIAPRDILRIMQRVVGAGINVYGVSFVGGPGAFSFFGNPTGRGFGSVGSPGVGGFFISILTP